MSNYNRLFYHFIWTTKNREFLINQEIEKILCRCIAVKISDLGGICHELGMTQDHIHLVATVPPAISLSCFMKNVKGNSTHLINNLFLNQYFGWQEGYGAVSFNEELLFKIKNYVINQKEHHKNNTLIEKLEATVESNPL